MGFGLGGEETKNRRIYKHTLRRSRYHAVLRLRSGHPTVLDRSIALHVAPSRFPRERLGLRSRSSSKMRERRDPELGDAKDDPSTSSTSGTAGT
jgi:hypothetical protein